MNAKLFYSAIFALCLFASSFAPLYAEQLININTADKAALATLTGIGEVKAQAIIDYRAAHGPFAKIEDIMNVTGIGPATFNNIKGRITVESASQQTEVPPPAQAGPQPQAAGSVPAPLITAHIVADAQVSAGAGSLFEAEASGAKDEPLIAGVRYLWNFGDGTTAEGKRVLHTYAYPGTYAVTLSAAYNYSAATARFTVVASAPRVALLAEGDGSLLLLNQSVADLNVGLWTLRGGGGAFTIPEDTFALAQGGIRFAPAVLKFEGGLDAQVFYPNGTAAAAAKAAGDSPLRGEPVTKNALSAAHTSAPVAASAGAAAVHPAADTNAEKPSQSAAVAGAPVTEESGKSSLWMSLAALAGLLTAGAYGVRYLGSTAPRAETPLTADEFEIE